MKKILIAGSGDYGNFIHSALKADFGAEIIDGFRFAERDIHEEYVYIATPHFTHQDMLKRVFAEGKHAVCEKPLGLSMEEVKNAYKIADDANLYLGAGLLMNHHPFYKRIKELQKELGPIVSMHVENNATESRIPSEWYWDKEKSGGWFIISELHWYHLFAWLTEAAGATVSEAKEVKLDGRTRETMSVIETDKKQRLTVDHRMDCTVDEISCTVKIQFASIEASLDGWIPSSLAMGGERSESGRSKDEVYRSLIAQNVFDMENGIPQDRQAIILAHAIALEAQRQSDLAAK